MYRQKICMPGMGDIEPMQKAMMSVKLVIVIDTAASPYVSSIRSFTGKFGSVFLHAAIIMNISSRPIPEEEFKGRDLAQKLRRKI